MYPGKCTNFILGSWSTVTEWRTFSFVMIILMIITDVCKCILHFNAYYDMQHTLSSLGLCSSNTRTRYTMAPESFTCIIICLADPKSLSPRGLLN